MAVHYGLSMPNFGDWGDPNLLVELATEAEAAGWDGYFLWDHIRLFDDWVPPVVDPWVSLGAIALATERIKLGPMVTPLSRRRPHKVARETVTLDHLSGGRLILGVGLGEPADIDFATFGDEDNARRRADMLDEALEVITGLWSGEPFAHHGTHYRVAEAAFLPKPVQEPRIPIWVAGQWPHRRPMQRAARWDGAFPINTAGSDFVETTPADLESIVAYITSQRADTGAFDVVLSGPSPTDAVEHAELMARYAEAGLTWWLEAVGLPDRPPRNGGPSSGGVHCECDCNRRRVRVHRRREEPPPHRPLPG
jgi:alkanesulfonate monooxygenase SsuD/methylene tetrahydromethanopterin reductase-like flavin-dependent oxidoreductase (luciferase family)